MQTIPSKSIQNSTTKIPSFQTPQMIEKDGNKYIAINIEGVQKLLYRWYDKNSMDTWFYSVLKTLESIVKEAPTHKKSIESSFNFLIEEIHRFYEIDKSSNVKIALYYSGFRHIYLKSILNKTKVWYLYCISNVLEDLISQREQIVYVEHLKYYTKKEGMVFEIYHDYCPKELNLYVISLTCTNPRVTQFSHKFAFSDCKKIYEMIGKKVLNTPKTQKPKLLEKRKTEVLEITEEYKKKQKQNNESKFATVDQIANLFFNDQ